MIEKVENRVWAPVCGGSGGSPPHNSSEHTTGKDEEISHDRYVKQDGLVLPG
jgi:hypothetical protein